MTILYIFSDFISFVFLLYHIWYCISADIRCKISKDHFVPSPMCIFIVRSCSKTFEYNIYWLVQNDLLIHLHRFSAVISRRNTAFGVERAVLSILPPIRAFNNYQDLSYFHGVIHGITHFIYRKLRTDSWWKVCRLYPFWNSSECPHPFPKKTSSLCWIFMLIGTF